MTGLADMAETKRAAVASMHVVQVSFAALMQSIGTPKEEQSFSFKGSVVLYAFPGPRSANGLQCLFSSHMTPLASLPNLHSASWASFLPPHTPTCDGDSLCVFPLKQ